MKPELTVLRTVPAAHSLVDRGGATGRNPLEEDEPTSPIKAHVNPRKNESQLAIGNDAPPPQPKKNLPQLVSHLSLGGTAGGRAGS